MPDLSVPGIPGGISLPFQEPYLEGLLYSRLGILKPIRVLQIQCSEGGWLKKQAEAFPFPKLIEFYGMEEDPSLLHELRRKEPQFLVFGREFLKFGFPEGFFHFLYFLLKCSAVFRIILKFFSYISLYMSHCHNLGERVIIYKLFFLV